MGKIVAVANQKGGVGKTTTAVNLSACVAALGKKVLIVDLDPQGNSTTGYGISKRSVEMGTYEVLIGETPAAEAIRKTNYRTDVLPSNTRLAGAGLELIDLPGYDYIFIDCPPSLDLLTLNGLCACDSVLIPIQCEYYALEGLSELISTLKTVRRKYNSYLDIEGVVFTMYAGRYNLTLQVVEGLPDHHPPDHPHLGGAQLRAAHQLLRAQGQGQRGLYGPRHRVRQAEPSAGPAAPPPAGQSSQDRGICKDARTCVRRGTDAKRKRGARPRAGEPV